MCLVQGLQGEGELRGRVSSTGAAQGEGELRGHVSSTGATGGGGVEGPCV